MCDLHLQAIDLQRILDGEKAQRGDATRRLADLARQAGRLRKLGPEDDPALAELEAERAKMQQQAQQHTAQVSWTAYVQRLLGVVSQLE